MRRLVLLGVVLLASCTFLPRGLSDPPANCEWGWVGLGQDAIGADILIPALRCQPPDDALSPNAPHQF